MPYEAGLGQAWVEALLDAPEAFLVSPPAALLLTDCPLIAAEVCQLRTGRERMPANAELKLLRELAALLHPVSGAGFPVAAALALAGFAASCGWPEAMDRALERALEALPLEAALRALEATHGTSLLSAAVISGSPATVTRVRPRCSGIFASIGKAPLRGLPGLTRSNRPHLVRMSFRYRATGWRRNPHGAHESVTISFLECCIYMYASCAASSEPSRRASVGRAHGKAFIG